MSKRAVRAHVGFGARTHERQHGAHAHRERRRFFSFFLQQNVWLYAIAVSIKISWLFGVITCVEDVWGEFWLFSPVVEVRLGPHADSNYKQSKKNDNTRKCLKLSGIFSGQTNG